ncbi:MAG: Grx4 family monothiol glutaredoxin [Hyphomicrobiaceae bacterium]|nr:Grx4 family monothiol glutaredoxin [Hyphomicrobiaceae bacterium]
MTDHSKAHEWIRQTIADNDVVLFMKGNRAMPQCGFSATVAKVLDHVGVAYKDVNVLEDMGVREGIKSYTNWPTIPQLYVKGEFVGGCDIVREMFQDGELQTLLQDKGLIQKASA